jgi:dTDP-4-amino-4,6-dideoxy-D-galactose acyltransferase
MISRLTWESEFFGFDIAQLKVEEQGADLTLLNRVVMDCATPLIQTIVPIAETKLTNALEGIGFRLIDLKVTYRIGVAPVRSSSSERSSSSDIHVASVAEIPELRRLAADLFLDSRFFHQPFPPEKARLLFSVWVEKAVLGTFDEVCLTLTRKGRIAGFVTLRGGGQVTVIGLIGVSREERCSGAGSALIDAALQWAAARGTFALDVSTQGKNLAAQNLFISKGGRVHDVGAWLYRTAPGRGNS